MNLLRVPLPLPLDLPLVSPPLLFFKFSICFSAVSSFLLSLENSLSEDPPFCTPERAVFVELSDGADGNGQSIKSKKGSFKVALKPHTVPAKVCST